LYEEENCEKIRTFAQGKYRNRTIEFGDSSPQSKAMEYV
jgi:hypothetical protein